MGSRFPETVPGRQPCSALCRPYEGRSLPFGRSWRFSCSGGHSVVTFATFLFLDFGLCMGKEKQIQKTARGFFRSRLCICQMKYVYYSDIQFKYELIIIQTSVLVKPCRRKFLREAADRRSAMVQMQRKNSRKVQPIGGTLRKPVRFCPGANAR